VSARRLAAVALHHNSTIARTAPKQREPKPFVYGVVSSANRLAASSLERSSPMPKAVKPRKPIPKRNHEHAAKRDKAYRAGLAKYHASETAKIVEARAGGICEFSVADDPTRLPLVRDVRVDRARPAGYSRCQRRCRSDHHCSYRNFGGGEVPEQMLKGCTRCHEYVESLKPTSRFLGRRTRRDDA
jgi:hypothetical protein